MLFVAAIILTRRTAEARNLPQSVWLQLCRRSLSAALPGSQNCLIQVPGRVK